MLERRPLGRRADEIRPVTIETGVSRFAEGSALIRSGDTHVLCTASIEDSVPRWLESKGSGWVTAEYSMLPRATHTRTRRDREKLPGRTLEIQRLIGRALRACVDLTALGPRSIVVDCDVIQADGGTRTAAITGGFVALAEALARLSAGGAAPNKVLTGSVSGVSVGMHDGKILVDLDYEEDSSCEVDMNFVVTGDGRLVEVQGTGERATFSPEDSSRMMAAALKAAGALRAIQAEKIAALGLPVL